MQRLFEKVSNLLSEWFNPSGSPLFLAADRLLVGNDREHWLRYRLIDGPISMTGEESRRLKIGDRVCWDMSRTDLGTIIKTDWNEVTIKRDDGKTISVQHDDMARVERMLANLV